MTECRDIPDDELIRRLREAAAAWFNNDQLLLLVDQARARGGNGLVSDDKLTKTTGALLVAVGNHVEQLVGGKHVDAGQLRLTVAAGTS